MVEKQATVVNGHGIHCRPSAVIIKAAKDFSGSIRVTCERGETDLRSIMGLIALGLEGGATVTVRVDGSDDDGAMCDRLVELFETPFDFPRP